ncbi:MAG: phosphatase PAP2 family protein [Acidobacteriota bacterium]
MANLPRDLRKNFKALFSWTSMVPASIITGSAGTASGFDDEVQEYFGETERFGKMGDIAGNPFVLTGAFGGLIVAGRLSEDDRFRSLSYRLIQGFALNNAVTFALKVSVRRKRPDGGNHSFPSGHASNVFTAAAILGDHYGKKVSIPLHLFGLLVSLTRLDKDSHWVSDSVAGAGLGLLIGHTVIGETRLPTPSRHLTWMPTFPADGVGIRFFIRP